MNLLDSHDVPIFHWQEAMSGGTSLLFCSWMTQSVLANIFLEMKRVLPDDRDDYEGLCSERIRSIPVIFELLQKLIAIRKEYIEHDAGDYVTRDVDITAKHVVFSRGQWERIYGSLITVNSLSIMLDVG